MIRLVRLRHPAAGRRVALVDEPNLRLLTQHRSVYDLAQSAIQQNTKIESIVATQLGDAMDYDDAYMSKGEWKLLPPIDHPTEAARCLVTGTGLTHKASAENRQSMHGAGRVAHGQHEDVSHRDRRRTTRGGMCSARRRSGFTKASARF